MVKCSVVGATGYTGIELIRLLARHPQVEIAHLTTRSDEKIPAGQLVPELPKSNGLVIQKENLKLVARDSDIVFLALPHTTAMDAAAELYKKEKVVIDLSADFRLKSIKDYETWYEVSHRQKKLVREAIYGLPEIYRAKIKRANLIANPGCYPTGAILGLYPLLKERLINLDPIVIDSKSGVSGAGKKLSFKSHFVEVNENFNAYKVNRHQHMPEIEQTLSDVAKAKIRVTFVPHLLPLSRGLFSTIYVQRKAGVKPSRILEAFRAYYQPEPFVRFLGEGISPSLADVRYTNFCDLGVQTTSESNSVVIMTAIDNLTKGASGQAIQNMNIRFGFDEEAGL